jgi:hypothetical protein
LNSRSIEIFFNEEKERNNESKRTGYFITTPKAGKEKDVIPIPHAITFSKQDYCNQNHKIHF